MNIVKEESAVSPNDVETLQANVHCDSSIIGHCTEVISSTTIQSDAVAAVALSGDMETVTETVTLATTATITTTTAPATTAISDTTIIPSHIASTTTLTTSSIETDSATAIPADVNSSNCNLEKNNLPEGVRVLRNVASNVETISNCISTSEDIKKLKHVQGRSNSTGRLYNSSRRVSFPENDSELVTGYLEPADPWACGMYIASHYFKNKKYLYIFIL